MNTIHVGYFVTLAIAVAFGNSDVQPSALDQLTHPFVKKFLEIRRVNATQIGSMVGKGQHGIYTHTKYDTPPAHGTDFTDPFYKTQAGINLKKNFVDSLRTIYTDNKADASQTFEDPFYRKSSGSNTGGIYDNVYNNYDPFRYIHSGQQRDFRIPDVLPQTLHRVNDPFQGPRNKLPDMLPEGLRRVVDPYGRVGGIREKGILEASLQNVVDPYRTNAGGIRTTSLQDMYLPASSDPFYKTSGGFRPVVPAGNYHGFADPFVRNTNGWTGQAVDNFQADPSGNGFVDPFFRNTKGWMGQPASNMQGIHGGNNMLPGVTFVDNSGTESGFQGGDVNVNDMAWGGMLDGSSFEINGGTSGHEWNIDDPLSWYRKGDENIYYPENEQHPSPVVKEKIQEVPKVEPEHVVKNVEPTNPVMKPKAKEVEPAKVVTKGKKSYS